MVYHWTEEWGPVTHWPRKFKQIYDEAAERGDDAVAEFLGDVNTHVDWGRYILLQLRKVSFGRLPQEGGYVAYVDLWNQSYELMACLHEGIAILEVRLDIMCHGPNSANTRRYRDLVI
jgi:hypothetical protein